MSVAKVIEIIAEGESIEDAIRNGVAEAGKTVRNIRSVYVKDFQALVEDHQVVKYRVNAKVTFVVD
ncbi:dodecin family protein [Rhodocaloribacter litoris]|uniref:dodecin family protein n=1 Tax=Rhodocaloribacter litoris TaxID=2558931 RepID=UPI001422B1BF|nr:dodecin family protein [Rhodocaloribacter litoris]QXD17028.1 dodecin family protein [Rhodocaloribacter litoris]GIV60036.1 MAG: hypothetical protein KatS3mg043_1125 [Rhodothermaceae bacterium]